ncbi:DEAD/DEAH box helicase family protein [Lederbergia lenta]|uniref:Shikimate kinase n=1 Tax=Lederbergia lenta TaxID=1467 RepID=A0A2X4WFI7_LEDLE|nr:AAA family ATPase [Lederbergia lenta]MCM3109566.1 AAA family ATPase [Lederbergia lenta]MEC2324680.1 AAA family ATPase [Lederbergia lenta]SQI58668.1 shikimate kinase [Lederbergia lenta]
MHFILIFGPQAVGKMTVGQELEKITDLKLFHNHMTIELVEPFFGYGTEAGSRLVQLFRQKIFEEVAKSNLYGLIFTYVWAFDQQEDWDYVEKVCKIFEEKGGTIYFVELEADIGKRLERNTSPLRLEHKPSKRNIDWSENELKKSMEKYRLNSEEGEIIKKNYIKINNSNVRADEVAQMIKVKFQL